MARIEGLNRVLAALKLRSEPSCSVIVGYTAAYAVYVHEDLEAVHPVGQAKFLEQPAREHAAGIADAVAAAKKRGATLPQALLVGGYTLQRFSLPLVPVDTGALRASGFVELKNA